MRSIICFVILFLLLESESEEDIGDTSFDQDADSEQTRYEGVYNHLMWQSSRGTMPAYNIGYSPASPSPPMTPPRSLSTTMMNGMYINLLKC